MIILDKTEITRRIDLAKAATAIDAAYQAASAGEIELPPVGHITFADGGDCHIKYGHRRGDEFFVIKVATGFPGNDPKSAPVNNGLSLVMSATTGKVHAVLHDEMLLTDVRTGIGGALATRALANPDATRMLVVGAGVQAVHQIQAHRALLDRDLDIEVWGRSITKAADVADQFDRCVAVDDLAAACERADIVVTVTGARDPIVHEGWITGGTHITAVGADAPGKHELGPDLLERADLLVADSRTQCTDHGEFSAVRSDRHIVELGEVLAGTVAGRTADDQITIADLTGIAAQDIAIATTVLS